MGRQSGIHWPDLDKDIGLKNVFRLQNTRFDVSSCSADDQWMVELYHRCASGWSYSKVAMPIQFRFHPEKAVEAAAILLKLHGKPMKYLGLLKMLYVADRMALQRMEQPITGDHYVSMDYGPVLSGVYDLIKGNSVDDALPLWSKFMSPRNSNYVALLSDPGDGELCEEEEEILKEVYQTFGHLDPFDVVEWTHDLPEWENPHGSAVPISVENVLRNVGKTSEEIKEIQKEAIREAYLDRVLHG